MFYITGDTHGEFSRIERFCERIKPTQDDTIVPSLTRQLFIRPEYKKAHTIYQRFSYTRDDLIR